MGGPKLSFTDRFLLFGLFALIVRDMFGGALTYYLNQSGFLAIWVVPDIIAALAIFLNCLAMMKQKRGFYILATGAAIFIYPALIGLMHNNNPIGIAAQAKVFFPFLMIMTNRKAAFYIAGMKKTLLTLLIITCSFVILNQFIQYPWIGYSFEKFGMAKEASRMWWDGSGNLRMAGATTGSFSAGTMIVLLYSLFTASRRINIFDAAIWIFVCYSEYITNFKTGFICIALSPLLLFGNGNENFRKINIFNTRRYFVIFLFITSSLIPWLIGISTVNTGFGSDFGNFGSLSERIYNTWPRAFEIIDRNYGILGYIFGCGFGSWGSASQYSGLYFGAETDLDNGFLYIFMNYGFLAFLLLIFAIREIGGHARKGMICIFSYAIVTFSTGLEGCALLILLGIGLSEKARE